MSLEMAATKFALPVIGTAGGFGVLLVAAATGGVEGLEKYGPYGLLALLLVWMTQQFTKKLDAIIEALTAVAAKTESLRVEMRATRTALERQELRLDAVENAVKACPGSET